MSVPTLIKQTWWPADVDRQREDKRERLLRILDQPREFPVEITVKRHQKKRSPEANAALWGVCYAMMADVSGYEKDEIHHIMCCKYFGTKVVEVMGERIERPIRTTTTNENGEQEWLSPGEFAAFVEFVIREAAFWFDIAIPPFVPKEARD